MGQFVIHDLRREIMMSIAYGVDLRERVIRYLERGATIYEAAERYEIGVATAGRWMREWRNMGQLEPGKRGHPPGSKLDQHADYLLKLLADQPDLTLEDVRRRLLDDHGMSAGIGTIWRFYNRHKISFKKKPVRQ